MRLDEAYSPSDDAIRALFSGTKTIAVVGLSENPMRPSYDVSEYLERVGFKIVPINPTITHWKGHRAYPSLVAAVEGGETIDLVDVFRRPEELGHVVDDALAAGLKTLWFQLGVVDEEQARRAMDAGMTVVMDRCTKVDHRRLVR